MLTSFQPLLSRTILFTTFGHIETKHHNFTSQDADTPSACDWLPSEPPKKVPGILGVLTCGVHAAKSTGLSAFLHLEKVRLTPRQFPFSFCRGDNLQSNGSWYLASQPSLARRSQAIQRLKGASRPRTTTSTEIRRGSQTINLEHLLAQVTPSPTDKPQ